MHSRLRQIADEEARRIERRKRRRIEDLRYALKKVDAIELDMSYDQVNIPSVMRQSDLMKFIGLAPYAGSRRVQGNRGRR